MGSKLRTHDTNFKVGDLVLLRLQRVNKSTPKYDSKPYVIDEIKGSMVFALRHDHSITRNVSFFKHYINPLDSKQP